MKNIIQKRKDIADWICDAQTQDSYNIGSCALHWIPGRQEFQLIEADGTITYDDGYSLVDIIEDADIEDYYPEIADYYEEEAAE